MKSYFKLTISICLLFFSLSARSQFINYCYEDKDGDGYGNPNVYVLTGILGCKVGYIDNNNFDCDDTNAEINPNTVWYRDFDNDGLRSWTDSLVQCTRPAGGYKLASELNSALGSANYTCGSISIKPNFANTFDCNETVANPYSGLLAWFLDSDGDGAIASYSQYIVSCGPPPDGKNYISSAFLNSPVGGNVYCKFKEDCNDNNPLENITQGWYLDGDNDGFPLNNTPEFVQCNKPAGPYKTLSQLTSLNEDCNDTNPAIFPGLWYEDKDGDGLITGNFVYACTKPAGYIFLPGGGGLIDCDDTDARATIMQGWYPDVDGDRHGGAGIIACKGPAGWFTRFELLSINDCNDNNNKIYPGAIEYCNGVDDDCDGLIDEDFCCPTSNVIYVKANATGLNNGNTWNDAYTKLQDALETSRRCGLVKQIWVAGGIYYPDEGKLVANNDVNAFFQLRDSLEIYGGLAGTEATLAQRNPGAGIQSILSGEIQQDGIKTNNSNNLVWGLNLGGKTLLDGFVIESAYSTIVLPEDRSRGMALQVQNSTNPIFMNLIIRNNEGNNGPAITCVNSQPLFANCVINNNRTFIGNGAVYNLNASPTFFYCSIANNFISGSEFTVIKNAGTSSPGIVNSIVRGSSPSVSGGMPNITYSVVQNSSVWPGTGNSNADPLFINEASGNLQLKPCSPAINTGQLLIGIPTDILGTSRVIGGAPDRGAYELATEPLLYVNAASPAGGDGSSWATALRSLQDAIRVQYCTAIKQIWVAKGTYTPTTDTNRDSSFTMSNNLAIYGGFAGTETLLSQRNWVTNKTILSGDIGVLNNASDNTYNVVRNDNNGLNNTAILDGFTITGGNASSASYVGSVGGAIFNRGGSAVYRNCTLTGNQARVYAGGFFSEAGSPLLINSIVAGNTANIGAGAYNESATTNIINCTFAGNLASGNGGGFYTYGLPVATMRNCIVWGNSSGMGVTAVNSNAPLVSNSLIQGGNAGTGNLSTDPAFVITPAPGLGSMGDLRLLACSPAINTGSNASLPAGTTTDFGGAPRIAFTNVDMGAYERQSVTLPIGIYVDATATGRNDGTDWANAYTTLQAALNDLNTCAIGLLPGIFISTGTYTARANTPFNFDKLNATILGGYPAGGGTRNATANTVIIKGDVMVFKTLRIDGVRVVKQ